MCLPGTVEAVRDQAESNGERRFDRRAALLGGLGTAAAAAFPARALAVRGTPRGHPDLTHVFTAGFPAFTFDPARRTLGTIPSGGFYSQEWTFGEHSALGHAYGRARTFRRRRPDRRRAPSPFPSPGTVAAGGA